MIGLRPAAHLLPLVLAIACSNAGMDASPTDLPNRTIQPDLSRVTADFRRDGGNAFVVLTAQPTRSAVEALHAAGLRPAEGFDQILTFDSLQIRTAWGRVPPNGVEKIARLRFVVGIEPSADRIGYWAPR